MSLKMKRAQWLFAPDIARALKQTGSAENGLCVACHPSHKGQRKGNTQARRVNAKMSQGIFELHNAVVPIGSGSFYVT